MGLLPHDKQYLDENMFNYEVQETPGETILVIKDYPISISMFDKDKVNVLIKIPNGYPMAELNMFWITPQVHLKVTNSFPPNADLIEPIIGETWQRFSRHYPWKPTFNLQTHLNVVKEVLMNGRG